MTIHAALLGPGQRAVRKAIALDLRQQGLRQRGEPTPATLFFFRVPACLPYWLPIPESDRSSHGIPNFAGNPTFPTERRPKSRRSPNEGRWEAPRRLTHHRRRFAWTRSVPLWIESWMKFFRRYKGGVATHRGRPRLPCCPNPHPNPQLQGR